MAICKARPQAAEVVPSTVLAATDLTRQYGEGDSAVHALRGVSLEIPRGPVRRGDGAVRLRPIDGDALSPRRARYPHVG